LKRAGLLAQPPSERPSRQLLANSGGDILKLFPRAAGRLYSYGDSAGFAPDFPFNDLPEAGQPFSWRKCMFLNRPDKYFSDA